MKNLIKSVNTKGLEDVGLFLYGIEYLHCTGADSVYNNNIRVFTCILLLLLLLSSKMFIVTVLYIYVYIITIYNAIQN